MKDSEGKPRYYRGGRKWQRKASKDRVARKIGRSVCAHGAKLHLRSRPIRTLECRLDTRPPPSPFPLLPRPQFRTPPSSSVQISTRPRIFRPSSPPLFASLALLLHFRNHLSIHPVSDSFRSHPFREFLTTDQTDSTNQRFVFRDLFRVFPREQRKFVPHALQDSRFRLKKMK